MTPPSHLVDILIPTYNYGRFIGECLASVAAQTFKNYKVFVQDNASTDDTETIVRAWANKIPIEYERNESNLGIYKNHILLGQKITAKYHIYLYSDDLWEPDFLAATVDALESNPSCCIAYTDWFIFYDGTNRIANFVVPFRGLGSGIYRDNETILYESYIPPSFSLRRNNVLQMPDTLTVGMHAYGDQLAHFYHASLTGAFYFVDRKLARYRKHGHSDFDRAFSSKTVIDDTFIFYGRVYGNTTYSQTLRLLAKICEITQIFNITGVYSGLRLLLKSSLLHILLARHCRELTYAIVRIVFSRQPQSAERQPVLNLLSGTTGYPHALPPDVIALIQRDVVTPMPSPLRFTFIAHATNGLDAKDALLNSLSHLFNDNWQVILAVDTSVNGHENVRYVAPDLPPVDALTDSGRNTQNDWCILLSTETEISPDALIVLIDAIHDHHGWVAIYTNDFVDGRQRIKSHFNRATLAEQDDIGALAIAAPVFCQLMANTPLSPDLPYVLCWQIAHMFGSSAIGHLSDALFNLPQSFQGASPELRQACAHTYTHATHGS